MSDTYDIDVDPFVLSIQVVMQDLQSGNIGIKCSTRRWF